MPRLSLLIDADDTLWENNIYFERAFDNFCDFLDHSALTPPQIREVLNEIELVNAKIHGYGSVNFGKNLQQAYQHLAQRSIDPDDLSKVMTFAEKILLQPIEMIPGVEQTLEELGQRHDLALFTKGHPDEQRMKVDRSGLGRFFGHTGIVKEKQLPWPRVLSTLIVPSCSSTKFLAMANPNPAPRASTGADSLQ